MALLRDLWSVAGVPGGAVVAVGDGGATFRFDGVSFAQTPRVSFENLRSVWIASPDTMLVVGEEGALLLGNGTTWFLQPQPTRASLSSIWGTSMRDVFAVGTGGIILHFDGASWDEQESGTIETLASVSGSAPDDVYAVGTAGTILHYDGADWAPMTSSTRDVLQCVVADAGNPIAVGANGAALQLLAGTWSHIDLNTTNWLYGVCRNGANTWVGGSHLIRVNDGTEWSSEAPGSVPILRGVCTDADGEVVVVGDEGYVARGRDHDWIVDEGVDARTLYCAFRTQSGDLFAGGINRILHFDGTEWDVEASDFPTWYGFGESSTHVYAIGSNATMRRRSGSTWLNVDKPDVNQSLNAMAWVSDNEAYVVGDGGTVLHGSGFAWVELLSNANVDIRDVIANPGDPARHALAVGESGALFVLNPTGVTALESPTSANLYALVRAPNGDILALGGGAALLRYRAAEWSVEEAPVLQPLFDAWVDGEEIFAVGGGIAGGLVLRFGTP